MEKYEKKHRSFDDQHRSMDSDDTPKEENANEINSKDLEDADLSFKSDDTIKGGVRTIFAEEKQRKKMLLERISKFGHIVQTISKDKLGGGKYQSFSRGEANIIFSMCSGK